MAYYIGSPLGQIRGRLGGLIFKKWRNKNIITTLGTIKNTNSIKQRNTRIIFSFLNSIATRKFKKLMLIHWRFLCKSRGGYTGRTLFVHKNGGPLYHSIPNKNKLISKNNRPEISRILLSDGNLEMVFRIENATYNKENGELWIEWDTRTFKDGSPEDIACIAAIYFKTYNDWDAWWEITNYKRKEGKAKIITRENLEIKFITAFIFFITTTQGFKSTNRFSISTACFPTSHQKP